MEYNFREIEKKWQKRWEEQHTYRVEEDNSKKKFYVLNMFPYPSGAGLHVGHPLGYIASDIYARHKRLEGYNVLNPMGYDAYGLPAEQYAIQTGQHPAVTTETNSVSRSIGAERYAPATLHIINGRSGLFKRCSIRITTTTNNVPYPSPNFKNDWPNKARKDLTLLVAKS